MLDEGKEVLSVAGHKDVGAGFDRGRKNCVVSGVARDCFYALWRTCSFRCELSEQLTSGMRSPVGEAEILGEHAVELGTDELGDDELDSTLDCFLEQATGRAVCDQRRDEDVRIAENAKNQACP